MDLRAPFLHVRKCVFGDGEHLKNVASEDALGHFEVDFLEVLAHCLLGGIVHQDVNGAVSLSVSLVSGLGIEADRD